LELELVHCATLIQSLRDAFFLVFVVQVSVIGVAAWSLRV